jgi:SET domain-containing protein
VPKTETPTIDSKYACFNLILKESKIHRWGVFAGEPIPLKRKIMEYTGELISRREIKKRAGKKLNYIFTIDSYWARDGMVGGSGAQYVNHCCEPNVQAVVIGKKILYYAKRPIKKGEELLIDYHFDAKVEKVKCLCGAKGCRGTINDLPA